MVINGINIPHDNSTHIGKDIYIQTHDTESKLQELAFVNLNDWCKDNNVPYLRLLMGAPNTEHYVIRRVYEKLRLIGTYNNTPCIRRIKNPQTGRWMEISLI